MMYKVVKGRFTHFVSRYGYCWVWMRDNVGHEPIGELRAKGWEIKPARDFVEAIKAIKTRDERRPL